MNVENTTHSAVWDVRNFRRPVVTKEGITTLYPGTNAIFSPDEKYILTGTGIAEKGMKGQLLILRRDDLEKVAGVELDSTVVKVLWHSRINQVSCGVRENELVVSRHFFRL